MIMIKIIYVGIKILLDKDITLMRVKINSKNVLEVV